MGLFLCMSTISGAVHKDGAFSFASEVPSALKNAKNTEGFVKLTGLKVGGRTSVEGCCCDVCRRIMIQY